MARVVEPLIQYATTADGVSIAYWTLGEGMPMVEMHYGGFSHIQLEWEIPAFRRLYQRFAQRRMLVRYDSRGCGLSRRDVTDYSLGAHLLDLEAVVDRLGSERVTLYASGVPGPVAIAYAVRHPEKVSHLMLWCTYARASDFWQSPQVKGLVALADSDWKLASETAAHAIVGWSGGESSRKYAALVRESATPEAARAAWAASGEVDVTALLPEVRSPTLVVHRRQLPFLTTESARQLASGIPSARLLFLEGDTMGPVARDWEAVAQTIDEFLGQGLEAPAAALAKEDVHTVLFTDIESSTTLTQRLGDARAQELLRTHNTIVRDALKACGGTEVKHTGDGIMASFSSASRALQCAISIQQGVAGQVDTPFRVRIGLNAGEPVAEEQDLFGTAVQLARRVCDHADPGQILVSDVVRQLAMGKGFLFSDHGDVELRGFEDPVRLYEVRWHEID